jgi:DNA mismatch repair ATPase MutS
MAAVGEIEALAALAGLAHDNPDWCVPRVARSEPPRLTARQLGHPLLAEPARVCNDVELGPPGTFLLVTGSNMSGKSTLLRAVGVNVVLAQAGGRCCAEALSLPPLALGTSVLIEDSLADGYSFFMAELRRLKEIVELAAACHAGGERTLLFLLDEILRGTNASERRIAVRRVLLHLMKQGAIGAVSTHDLALAEDEALAVAGQAVHFRETVHTEGEGPAMTFDYRIREGVATTVNALKLLDLVGLPRE